MDHRAAGFLELVDYCLFAAQIEQSVFRFLVLTQS